MIELRAANKKDLAVWETILEISEWFPTPWTLIGARMVQLHAMAAGRDLTECADLMEKSSGAHVDVVRTGGIIGGPDFREHSLG